MIALLSYNLLFAQQYSVDNQYIINKFSISPAFGGLSGNTETFVGYKKSWLGIPGAPNRQIINFNLPYKDKYGFGLNIVSEDAGNFEHFSGQLSYAYHVRTSDASALSFGLAAEYYRNQLDISNVKSYGQDPFLLNNQSLTAGALDMILGINYSSKGMNIGIVVPRLLGAKLKYDKSIAGNNYTLNRQLNIYGSYPTKTSENTKVEPYVVFRNTLKGQSVIDIGSMLYYKQMLWGAITYRTGGTMGLSIGGALDQKLVMHYVYEFGFSGIMAVSQGSHELSLGYLIEYGKRKNKITVFREKPAPPDLFDEAKVRKVVDDAVKKNQQKNDDEMKKVKDRLAELEQKEPGEALVKYKQPYVLKNIKFGNNSDKLFSSSYPSLDKLVKKLTENKALEIKIVGYTDNQGSPKYNQRLSLKRSQAVKDYLVGKGVDAKRMEVDGQGDKNPIAENDSEEGRSKNRRIEIQEKDK